MNCSYCGSPVNDADVFCPNCGTRLKTTTDTKPLGAQEETGASPDSGSPYITYRSSPAGDEKNPTAGDPTPADTTGAWDTSNDQAATSDPAYGMGASTTPEPNQPYGAAPTSESMNYGAPPPTSDATTGPARDAAYSTTPPGTGTDYVSPSPASPYGTPPMPPAAKDPTTAFIAEIIAGVFGFLGIGHIYAGQTTRGVVLLVCWWAFLVVEVLLMAILIGFCLLPLNLLVPLGSAFWLKREMEGQPIRL